MRDLLTMRAVYTYMSRALRAAGALLAYSAAEGARWSNASLVASDRDAFAAQLRNDTSYPETSRVAADDWAAVVQRHNHSSMGHDFHRSGVALRTLVEEIHAKQRLEERAKEAQRQRDKATARPASRAGKRGGGDAKVHARRGRARGGRGRRRQAV